MRELMQQNNRDRYHDHFLTPQPATRDDEGGDDYDEEAEHHIWRSVN